MYACLKKNSRIRAILSWKTIRCWAWQTADLQRSASVAGLYIGWQWRISLNSTQYALLPHNIEIELWPQISVTSLRFRENRSENRNTLCELVSQFKSSHHKFRHKFLQTSLLLFSAARRPSHVFNCTASKIRRRSVLMGNVNFKYAFSNFVGNSLPSMNWKTITLVEYGSRR